MWLRSLCIWLSFLPVFIGAGESGGVRPAGADARVVINQPRSDRQIDLHFHGSASYGYGGYSDLYGYGREGDSVRFCCAAPRQPLGTKR